MAAIKLIGISGKIGSGKDTVARLIQLHTSRLPYDIDVALQPHPTLESNSLFAVKRFAGALKEIAARMLGVPVAQFEDPVFKRSYLGPEWDKFCTEDSQEYVNNGHCKMTVREFLQKLGTDAVRNNLHPNAWVNTLFAEYDRSVVMHTVTSVAYSTYNPELDGPENLWKPYWLIPDTRFPNEAKAIKDRGGIVIRVERAGLEHYNHASETALNNWDFDYVIDNHEEGVDYLAKSVEMMLEHFQIKVPWKKHSHL